MSQNHAGEALLAAAMRKHVDGDLAAAEALYRQALAIDPDHAPAAHYLGFLLQQSNRLPEAVQHLQHAIALDDRHDEWHFNLGIALARQQLADDAIAAFSEAIARHAGKYFYWTNLGAAFESKQDWLRAEQCYHAASRIDAHCPDAYYLLSALCLKLARYPEARHFHHSAIVTSPAGSQSKILLGQAFYELGRYDEACAVFTSWLAAEPDNPVARHLLAAYTGKETPSKETPSQEAPAQCASLYVEHTFDEFAHSFDHTLGRLHYCGPQLVQDYLASHHAPAAALSLLDLGCGTGLIGLAAKAYAGYLAGVDISQAMLDKAREKQCYEQLHKSDITAFLRAAVRQYDLITCMDTLNYLGQLDEVLALIYRRLRPGGTLLFSTEKLSGSAAPYQLNTSGRYSHSRDYLTGALSRSGLHIGTRRDAIIRIESGAPIVGEFVSAQRLE